MLKKILRKQIIDLELMLGKHISKVPLSPNAWTVLALFSGFVGFYFMYMSNILFGLVFFVISFILDVVDGSVAKHTGKQTAFGDYFDGMADNVVDTLFVVGIWKAGLLPLQIFSFVVVPEIILLLCIFGIFMTSFSKSHAAYSNPLWRENLDSMYGLLQRAERGFLFILAGICLIILPVIASFIMLICGIFSIITVAERFLFVYHLD